MDLKAVHEGIRKNRKRKRIGRGPGSKKGRYATKGLKGQRSRSGWSETLMKEGGQMPLFRRTPKRGFNNKWGLVVLPVNVGDLGRFDADSVVDLTVLKDSGLTQRPHDRVKILGDGDLDVKLTVHAHSFSKSAKEKIEKAGGTCVEVAGPHRGPKIKNKMRPKRRPVEEAAVSDDDASSDD